MSAERWRPEIEALVGQVWPGLQDGAHWIEAQCDQESSGNPDARSPAGAVGLMQLMPGTAREVGLVVTGQTDQRLIPQPCLLGGITYLKRQFDQLNEIPEQRDRLLWSFAAYNGGRGYIDFNGGPLNTALELARAVEPTDWWRWAIGGDFLRRPQCNVHGRHPDAKQILDYVAQIQRRFTRLIGGAA